MILSLLCIAPGVEYFTNICHIRVRYLYFFRSWDLFSYWPFVPCLKVFLVHFNSSCISYNLSTFKKPIWFSRAFFHLFFSFSIGLTSVYWDKFILSYIHIDSARAQIEQEHLARCFSQIRAEKILPLKFPLYQALKIRQAFLSKIIISNFITGT